LDFSDTVCKIIAIWFHGAARPLGSIKGTGRRSRFATITLDGWAGERRWLLGNGAAGAMKKIGITVIRVSGLFCYPCFRLLTWHREYKQAIRAMSFLIAFAQVALAVLKLMF